MNERNNDYAEFVVISVLTDNNLPFDKETYKLVADYFNISYPTENAAVEQDEEYYEDEGPYGGAFKDDNDLFYYKEGYYPRW